MAFEEDLFTYLSTYPGLGALIGTRLYPLLLPQLPTLPAVTYQRVSTPTLLEFERSLLPHPRFQFNCWATTFAGARAVADQVRAALDVYMGAMGATTVRASLVEDERDDYDPATEWWRIIVEAVIWYT